MTSSKSRRLPRCSHHHRLCPCHRPPHLVPKPAPGSISTHTHARDRTSSSGKLPSRASHYTHRTRHRTATPLFCSSMPTCHACSSRGELTRRPTPTLPQPVLAYRWCAYIYMPPPLHVAESPLVSSHFSWLTLGAPAPAAPARHRALRAAREHAAEVMPRERLVVTILIQHLEPVSFATDDASKVVAWARLLMTERLKSWLASTVLLVRQPSITH